MPGLARSSVRTWSSDGRAAPGEGGDRAILPHMGENQSPESPLLDRCRQRAALLEQARTGLVEAVRDAARAGHTTEEIAAVTGLPQSSVRDWAGPESRRIRPGPEPDVTPRTRR